MTNALMEALGLHAAPLKTGLFADYYHTMLGNLSKLENRRYTYHTYTLFPVNQLGKW
uniref:Uncharacterized protein n=1 Tax=Romanomermis culicivorax TaxID=13658 RepID=A0A915J3C0_ROMCU